MQKPSSDKNNIEPNQVDDKKLQSIGCKLQYILKAKNGGFNGASWSPNGLSFASGANDGTIRIWDIKKRKASSVLRGHDGPVNCIAWSPNSIYLASGGTDGTIRIWRRSGTWNISTVLREHEGPVNSISWSQNGQKLVSGGNDSAIRIWDTAKWKIVSALLGHSDMIYSVAWSPDGTRLASCGNDDIIRIWNPIRGAIIRSLRGHSDRVYDVKWQPDRNILASCSLDNTVRLWNIVSDESTHILEGHTNGINCISFSYDGRLLYSNSFDGTVGIWQCDVGQLLARLPSTIEFPYSLCLAHHPRQSMLASPGKKSNNIYIWDIDTNLLLNSQRESKSVKYTTAKLVLVGDSQVGKTALGWRLVYKEFRVHPSTHGQQFWLINDLCTTLDDGTQCEALLWDLAGQHSYRPIHAIFLDNVNLALMLFDPTNRENTLKGVEFWLGQLAGKNEIPPCVLIGTKADRGESILSKQELDQFCQRRKISGGYVSTSAFTGQGIDTLLQILKEQINKNPLPKTVTTITFKKIKDSILSIKALSKKNSVLLNLIDLLQQLREINPLSHFSEKEMVTALKHLENHGYIAILHDSSAQEYILFKPELLVDLASSIILEADKHPLELGSLDENTLLQGEYVFPELDNLSTQEQNILLDAAILRFLEHNICFREVLGKSTLLIFPGLIKLKRPQVDEVETFEDVSYIIRGKVENVYAALVVLLGYTPTFTRINQWKNQAQYEMEKGEICGFRMIEEREGMIELVLQYSEAMPEFGRKMFQGLFEKFLYQRDVDVTRFQPISCQNGHKQERTTVIKRQHEGKEFVFCEECGDRIMLPEIEKPTTLGAKDSHRIRLDDALARLRSVYEMSLVRVKGSKRDRSPPRCYISHAREQDSWVAILEHDLREAGIYILKDRAEVLSDDYIIVVGTPNYIEAWNHSMEPIDKDANLICLHLQQSSQGFPLVIPLLLHGDPIKSIPLELTGRIFADFRESTHYVVGLFDIVLNLYAIKLNNDAFEPLRNFLQKQWSETLSHLTDSMLKIESKNKESQFSTSMRKFLDIIRHDGSEFKKPTCFISYAHGEKVVEEWIEKHLASDLEMAEIEVVLDVFDNVECGSNVGRFIGKILECSSIIVVGTPLYLKKYDNKLSPRGNILASEFDLIHQRLMGTELEKRSVRPIIVQGDQYISLPSLLRGRIFLDFRTEKLYYPSLFDLILSIHNADFNDNKIKEIRARLNED